MKKQIKIAVVAVAALWSSSAMAYLPYNHSPKKPTHGLKANCAPASAKLIMEFNDVSALIEQGGSMFQNRQTNTAMYEVPKGGGVHAIYSGSLWMGGVDVNGQLKLAGLTFRTGNEFWPGPLTSTPGSGDYDPMNPVGPEAIRDFGDANIDPTECLAYDKFYTIRKAEVIQYNIWWECEEGIATEGCDDVTPPSNDVMNRIYAWPAHGDVSKFQDYWLAPFYDNPLGTNGLDGVYNPEDGDTPWYDDILGRDDVECGFDRRITLFGDETHWWVFNDKGNIHTEFSGDPIGMEIRAQAFSFATNDEVNRMTFFNYEMINRGTQTLYDTYFAQYLDPDVGFSGDDYVGCDVSRGLGYAFNGDLFDEAGQSSIGYGQNPPAIGVDFFEGPYQDPDTLDNPGPYYSNDTLYTPTVAAAIAGKGIVYKGIGLGYSDGIIDNERYGMRLFTYYTNGAAFPMGDPSTAAQAYNFMRGFWANGAPITYGGTGNNNTTTINTTYVYPADSDPLHWATGGIDPGFEWDEIQAGNDANDRRMVQSAGPFTLKPGAINNITVGIVYGRGSEGDLLSSVRAMKRADTKAQALFDACFKIMSPPDAPKLTIQELENELILMLENPISSNNYQETYAVEDEINIPAGEDRYYRFEGYQIYQLKDEETSIADVGDPDKAQLVAQCDLKNNISRLVNFEFDEALGFSIPKEKVNGENKGIKHTFKITEDEFATGSRRLVNHKTYYFVAVAYAHNEFKKYDPNDGNSLDGQKTPYISSRLSFDGTAIKSVSAIPHNPTPEADGTMQRIEYGSSPRVTRIDGYGNGYNSLEFTPATLNQVITTGLVNEPEYDYGAGPIAIKVVDPLNLVGGYFECEFHDYSTTSSNGADTASWTIYHYESEGGALIDQVSSERTIDKDNEQIIPQWGVSVQIVQRNYTQYSSGNIANKVTDILGSEMVFADSSKQWLTGVGDNDAFYPTNWIRSGEYAPDPAVDCLPDGPAWMNPCNYPDESNQDPDKLFPKVLNGFIAPHRLVGYQADFMPLAYYNLPSPGLAKNNASISFLPSVNIVITSDKSKWTRVPVIELGRTASLNIGGAQPGALRKSPSVDKDGNADGTGTGMGWFPGYAVDLESGARLYMAIGENSFLGFDGGTDMIWNPSNRMFDDFGNPVMGGVQPFYVFSYNQKTLNNYSQGFDFPAYIPSVAESGTPGDNFAYAKLLEIETTNSAPTKREFYGSLSWVAYPLLNGAQQHMATDVTIKLRVNKEYKNYVATNENLGKPKYSWSMDDISTVTASNDQLAEALKMINVVPNPYYAFSEYERTRLDTRVKITNLPEKCTVRIYTTNGKLVRQFKKDSEVTSIDWDLNNHQNIPVASGVYLIHVEVPGIGEVVLKFFGGMRQVDLQGI